MYKKQILIFFAVIFCLSARSNEPAIIPRPQSYTVEDGYFTFNSNTKIRLLPDNAEMRNAVWLFQEQFKQAADFTFGISKKQTSNEIVCCIDAKIEHPEAYRLEIKPNQITITASAPAGIFYALQSVKQLLPPEISGCSDKKRTVQWRVPCATVHDTPAFNYRGMMLDVCRHFMPKEFVMKFIDMLAFHKLNVFHWHLTDDQGWRIEIKKYPKLTEVGAFRRFEIVGHKNAPDKTWKAEPHGGFYTQDDIREVVEYAQKRFVTIIPEIEMPGHALAALSAYPELSCSGGPFEVVGNWGVFHDIFCAREETIGFLQDVVSEVADLFPGKYIHLGGDEAPKTRWKRCKACQDKMKSEGIKDETQLQTYFVSRVEEVLKPKGKKIICWDDAVDAEIPKTTTIMSWRGEEGGIKAAKAGNQVIMAPHKSVYFDYYQGDKNTEPLTIGGFLPIEKVYEYNPIPEDLLPEEAKRIQGVQANVWTEYMPNPKHVEYMAFPRMAALSEIAWTFPQNKDYEDFTARLRSILKHYDCWDINYRQPNN